MRCAFRKDGPRGLVKHLPGRCDVYTTIAGQWWPGDRGRTPWAIRRIMEYDRSAVLLDMWMAYEVLSREAGADRAAIEKLLISGLATLERDQKSLDPD